MPRVPVASVWGRAIAMETRGGRGGLEPLPERRRAHLPEQQNPRREGFC
jgi:hypothetical protein